MAKRLRHEASAQIVLLEAHRFVGQAIAMLVQPPAPRAPTATGEERSQTDASSLSEDLSNASAAAAGELKHGTTLAYPPDGGRSAGYERRELVQQGPSRPAGSSGASSGALAIEVDSVSGRIHAGSMASSERVQRALAAAAGLSKEEREELVAELIVGLERDREPEPGYDEA